MKPASLLLVALLGAGIQQTEYSRCEYVRLDRCDLTGCKKGEIVEGSYVLIPERKKLAVDAATTAVSRQALRCDPKGCSAVDVSVTAPGAFINLGSPAASYLLKVAIEDGIFTEIASTGFLTLIYHGRCQ